MAVFDPNKDYQAEALLPPGRYTVRWIEFRRKFGKKSGEPYLEVTFRIFGGEHHGQKLVDRISLKETALMRVQEYARASQYSGGAFDLGCREDAPNAYEQNARADEAIQRAFSGSVTVATVDHEKYRDKLQVRIVRYNTADPEVVEEARAATEVEQQAAGGGGMPDTGGSDSHFDDDDIPF